MSTMNRQGISWRQRLQESPWIIIFELTLIAAVFVADAYHLILFSKTPYLLALGWLSMRLRGQRWRDIGLSFPANWRRLLLLGIAAGIAMELLELFATQPLLVALTGKYPDLSDFHDLIGNVRLLLLLVAGSWIIAGVGEEVVWRGYILNRVADLLGRRRVGWTISIGIVSIVFGLAHLRAVHDSPARSVKALAERLGRDYKRVHGDVETLTASGLLLRENCNVSAPFDAITAEMRL
jgi:membrane protease YdiL (CAAX protease family)